jgi:hypothetical protein
VISDPFPEAPDELQLTAISHRVVARIALDPQPHTHDRRMSGKRTNAWSEVATGFEAEHRTW